MNGPLVHLVRPAAVAEKRPPLLLLLHGVGSHEGDLFGLASVFPEQYTVLSVRAPLTLRPGSYAWFPVTFTAQGPVADTGAAETARKQLAAFLRWALEEYGADPSGTVLAGLSQGAILAASLALTEPELVRSAVLMSGRILPEVLPLAASPERLKQTSFLVVHGVNDDRLPVHHGQASVQTLASLGTTSVYREFPMGHTISDESLACVRDWVTALPSDP